jgi:hypothetical protein
VAHFIIVGNARRRGDVAGVGAGAERCGKTDKGRCQADGAFAIEGCSGCHLLSVLARINP